MSATAPPTIDDVARAHRRIAGRLHHTPIVSSATFDEQCGAHVQFKAELLQKTGSFKARGMLNRVLALDEADRGRGLLTMSAGNAAAALAYAGGLVGAKVTVVMPPAASASKVAACNAYGADIVQEDAPLAEVCARVQTERDLVLVHPFADPEVIAGHGTLGLELVEQVPRIDAIYVPVGGGGLISGIAIVVKALLPGCRVIGVEPAGAAVVGRSLEAGAPVDGMSIASVADGLCAPWTTELNLGLVRDLVDEMLVVDDDAILNAQRLITQRTKLAVEPAGAAAVAPVLAGHAAGGDVAVVLSGGNLAS